MKISRPKPDVGKYTMIFHTRDKGNEVNMGRMKLLQQMSRVWKTDGLSSCSYRLLSVEHNPLYANITVDFWTAAWPGAFDDTQDWWFDCNNFGLETSIVAQR